MSAIIIVLLWVFMQLNTRSGIVPGVSCRNVQYGREGWGYLTSKIRPVCQLHLLVELCDDACHSMLNEVHLLTNSTFSYNVVVGLKDLKLQLAQHCCHKVGVSIGKQWHGGHELTAVEIYNFLVKGI